MRPIMVDEEDRDRTEVGLESASVQHLCGHITYGNMWTVAHYSL